MKKSTKEFIGTTQKQTSTTVFRALVELECFVCESAISPDDLFTRRMHRGGGSDTNYPTCINCVPFEYLSDITPSTAKGISYVNCCGCKKKVRYDKAETAITPNNNQYPFRIAFNSKEGKSEFADYLNYPGDPLCRKCFAFPPWYLDWETWRNVFGPRKYGHHFTKIALSSFDDATTKITLENKSNEVFTK